MTPSEDRRDQARRRYIEQRRLRVAPRTATSSVSRSAIQQPPRRTVPTAHIDGVYHPSYNTAVQSPVEPLKAPSSQRPADTVERERTFTEPTDTTRVPEKKTAEKPESSTRGKKRHKLFSLLFTIAAVLVLAVNAYIVWDTWQTNRDARAAFSQSTVSDGVPVANPSGAQVSEGEVSVDMVAAHKVAADAPRTIRIDRFNVNARVLKLGLTNKGAIDAPVGIWDTGWYEGSAKPGQGNMFIDGHVSGPTQPAVFRDLHKLSSGDTITIEKGDGAKLIYKVSSVVTQKVGDIDMASVLAGPGGDAVTLMTCGGGYLGDYSYDSRVIVVAGRT